MSTLRFPYAKLSPHAYQSLLQIKQALDQSSLAPNLIELVYLRVSQINGCAFCTEMHAKSLRACGMADAKLDSLAGWHVSALFDTREKTALAWAESLTHVAQTHAPDADYEALKTCFTEVEISDLTFAVALMNAFNRLAIGARQ